MTALSALLFLLGIALLIIARRILSDTGLPRGRVIYMDHAKLNPYPNALYDPELRLTGKPDYVVTVRGKPVPVEAKSSSSPSEPYLSHIMQLAAYCRLVESNIKPRPEKGIILYADRAFELVYSRNLEKKLISTIEDIRGSSQKPARSHDSSARCMGCGYQSICDVSLA